MDEEKFSQRIEETVQKTIKKHNLIQKEDKVLVAASGGKDSTTLLYILHKLGYNVQAMLIDQLLGDYSRGNKDNITRFCNENNIKLYVIPMREEYGVSVCYMKSVLDSKGFNYTNCAICGAIRRRILNKEARKLGVTKLATGHNLDDEAQTIMMNYLKGNLMLSAKSGPIAGILKSDQFIPRIKPLYHVSEADVAKYSKIHKFPVVYDPCPCATDSFRTSVKTMLNELEKDNPNAKENIVVNFEKIKPQLIATLDEQIKITPCKQCGEPTNNPVCHSCQIFRNYRNPVSV